ncbi:hypothetical protein ACWCOP_05875 [Maricaulaceae bacterium MS644]
MARTLMLFAAAAALTLGACAPAYEEPPLTPFNFGAELTPVLSWRDEGPSVRIRVPSNGCTTKDSFFPEVTGAANAGWAFDLALIRVHPDDCRAMLPTGVELSWTKDELGLPDGASLRVINPRNHDFY